MMFAKIFVVLLCSMVTVAYDAKKSKYKACEGECGATDLSIYRNTIHHGQWPFVALIYFVNDDRIRFICGGTIISKFSVITGE